MKKATDATVAEADNNNHSLPSSSSIEVAIWELRIKRAKSHPETLAPWCQYSIHLMEEWMSTLLARRCHK